MVLSCFAIFPAIPSPYEFKRWTSNRCRSISKNVILRNIKKLCLKITLRSDWQSSGWQKAWEETEWSIGRQIEDLLRRLRFSKSCSNLQGNGRSCWWTRLWCFAWRETSVIPNSGWLALPQCMSIMPCPFSKLMMMSKKLTAVPLTKAREDNKRQPRLPFLPRPQEMAGSSKASLHGAE